MKNNNDDNNNKKERKEKPTKQITVKLRSAKSIIHTYSYPDNICGQQVNVYKWRVTDRHFPKYCMIHYSQFPFLSSFNNVGSIQKF